MRPSRSNSGFTLIEVLISVLLGSMLLVGITNVVQSSVRHADNVQRQNQLQEAARFAMQRMVEAVSHSDMLLVPQDDNPSTSRAENVRAQSFPIPAGNSAESAVLALSMDPSIDVDRDGLLDSDNDQDGRINEDWPADLNFDFAPGISGVDDDGDGQIDEGFDADDDEDGQVNEDPIDGIDNDGDGRVDEDPGNDAQNDGCPGFCGEDDDDDGFVDETYDSSVADDDEDTADNEDWLDTRLFRVFEGQLIERTPVTWDRNGEGLVTGADFFEEVVAENVAHISFTRHPAIDGGDTLLDIQLRLRNEQEEEVVLKTSVRLGASR